MTNTDTQHLPKWARCKKTGNDVSGLSEQEWKKRICVIRKYKNHIRAEEAHTTALKAMLESKKKIDPNDLSNSGTPEGAKIHLALCKIYDDAFLAVINPK